MSAINKIEINGVEYDLGASGGLAFVGTRAEYEIAKLIPESQTGYIPSGTLVCITDENRTYFTSGTGSEQTLTLIARVMSAGDGITITNDAIKANTVTFTGTRAEWELLSSAQKAKYNIVNFTDEMECAYQDIYSTTEVKTNKVWIDGKPIYRKVIQETFAIASGGYKQIDITSLNIDTPIKMNFIYKDGSSNLRALLNSTSYFSEINFNASEILIKTVGGWSLGSALQTVIIEYTKTN